jgi:hypothetical protein
MKNKILAMEAAPAAIPPNPKIAAIIATTRKITVQRSITYLFKIKKLYRYFKYDLVQYYANTEKSVP